MRKKCLYILLAYLTSAPLLAETLADYWRKNPDIDVLDNMAGDQSFEFMDGEPFYVVKLLQTIIELLPKNKSLKSLTLYEENLGELGARVIAKALHTNDTLTELDLTDNHIGDRGAYQIALALAVNKTLKRLHLGLNYIGVSGTESLVDALKKNKTLKFLNMEDNNLGLSKEDRKKKYNALKELEKTRPGLMISFSY